MDYKTEFDRLKQQVDGITSQQAKNRQLVMSSMDTTQENVITKKYIFYFMISVGINLLFLLIIILSKPSFIMTGGDSTTDKNGVTLTTNNQLDLIKITQSCLCFYGIEILIFLVIIFVQQTNIFQKPK